MYGVNGGLRKYSSIHGIILFIFIMLSVSSIVSSACEVNPRLVDWTDFYTQIWDNATKIGTIVYNNTTVHVYYYNLSKQPFFILESGANCTAEIVILKDKPYRNPQDIIEKYFGNQQARIIYSVWSLGGSLLTNTVYLPYMQIIFLRSLDIVLRYLNIETGSQMLLPGGLIDLIDKKNNTIIIVDALFSLTLNQKYNNTIEYLKARIILSNIDNVITQSVYAEYYSFISENISAKTYYSHHIYIDSTDKKLVILKTKPIITNRSFNPRSIIIIYDLNTVIDENKIISLISKILSENPFAETSGNYSVGFNITEPLIIYNTSTLTIVDNAYAILYRIYNEFINQYDRYSSGIYDNPLKLVLAHNILNNRVADINIRWLNELENKALLIYEKEYTASGNFVNNYYIAVVVLLIIILISIALFPMVAWRKLSRTI